MEHLLASVLAMRNLIETQGDLIAQLRVERNVFVLIATLLVVLLLVLGLTHHPC